jgi:hypothetical protein
LLSTVKFRELCIKHGPRALEIIAEIAERGEPDLGSGSVLNPGRFGESSLGLIHRAMLVA